MRARHILAVLLVCGLADVTGAQPVTIAWRPPAGCSSGQAIVWNGSAWTCGSVLSTAGDGLTLTGSTVDLVVTSGGGLTVAANSVGLLASCASGQILKWSGAAWACDTDSTVGSGAVTGTGTDNFIPRWDGTTALEASLLSENATTLAYNTNKFTVVAASGNTAVAGTLDATGAITDGGNRVFSIAGAGLTSSGATVNVIGGTGITVNANDVTYDSAVIQSRVSSTCTLPNSIRAIAADGSVTCTTASLDTSNVSGTSGRSARFSGANTVGNGAFTDDGTNATIAGTLGLTSSASDTQLSVINTSTGGRSYIVGSGGNGAAYPNTFYIYDNTASAVRMTISSAGVMSVPGGGTTAANWTTTGTGDVVSADDVTATDDLFVGDDSTLGDDATDVQDMNGDLTKFGSTTADGATYIYNNILGWGAATDADVTGYVNYYGYAPAGVPGTTRFRSLIIADGKSATIATFTGSDKSTNLAGETIVSGGTIANTANGIHFGFAANAGTISAIQPGTAYRALNLEGSSLLLNVSGVNEITINGSANTIVDPTTITGLLTATAGGTTGNNWTTTGSGDLVSADDLTVADDATVTDGLQAARIGVGTTPSTILLDVRNASTADAALFYHSGGAGTYTASANFVEIRNDDTSTSYDLLDVNVANDGTKRLSFNSAGVLSVGNDLSVADDATITDVLTVNGHTNLGDGTADITTITGLLTHTSSSSDTQFTFSNTSSGGRSYIFGAGGNGSGFANSFYLYDNTASALRMSISSAGLMSVPGGATTAANWTTTGSGDLVSADDLTVADDAAITGDLTVDGSLSINSNTINLGNAASDTITFYGGAIGINGPGATHLEWNDDFLFVNTAIAVGSTTMAVGSIYQAILSGTASQITDVTGVTARPGIAVLDTGSTTTGKAAIVSSANAVNFGDGQWHWSGTVGFPTLSTSGEEYQAVLGFFDTHTAANQTDGCYFSYDRGDVATNPGTGSATGGDIWQCWCANGGTRTGYTINGSNVSDESFTTVNSTVAALTYPNTNIYRLEVRMAGSTRAEFYINGTKRCNISTNLPSGSSRLEGTGAFILKSAGSTARTLHIDQTRVFVDLTAVRSP